MKKLFTMMVILVFAGTTINAQEGQFYHRVKAGYAGSGVKIKADGKKIESDLKSSYYVGVFSEYKFHEKVGIQLGLMFSPLGAQQTEKLLDKEIKTKMSFGTLSLPLSAKYYVIDGLNINAGLNFGFNLSKKGKIGNGKIEDLKHIETFNLGGLLGLEYTLNSGLSFDINYNVGLNNISKEDKITMKNNFFLVGLGYRF